MTEWLHEGDTVRFKKYGDECDGFLIPVTLKRNTGLRVTLYPWFPNSKTTGNKTAVHDVVESIVGIPIQVLNPWLLDLDMQVRYGYLLPEHLPELIKIQEKMRLNLSQEIKEHVIPNQKPPHHFGVGFNEFGIIDSYGGLNDPRGYIGPDPRGPDPRGPR